MKLYRTTAGIVVEESDAFFDLGPVDWDELLSREDLEGSLAEEVARTGESAAAPRLPEGGLLPPIQSQEVWAAGVTYFRSRTARMEESKESGGGSFYDRVYEAERPELFLKATPWRVVGPGGRVRIRADSRWNVPEPELALVINPRGEIVGYTIGNDMSSRDIEGENPLYLPQAKFYDGACALGPCVLVAREPLAPEAAIEIEILRGAERAFADATSVSQMKRTPSELVEYLYRETSFPKGAVLLTGTGIVPPDSFTLQSGDEVRITIGPIGTLINTVA